MTRTSHPVHLARAASLLAAGATVALLAVGTAPAAFAAPGDNGDIKVHESTTPPDDQNDEPKVCTFHLAAFNFDTVQKVTWNIEKQPGDQQVAAGAITLESGNGRTADMNLPNGMYKVTWTFEGEQGSAKHKVFKVDCPPGGPGSGGPGGGGPGSGGGPGGAGGAGGGGLHGGLNTGGGGTAQDLNAVEVGAGSALLVLAAGLGIRAVRRRAARNAAS
ncbi:hypothetical protein F4556_007225 [Kitasatospora gansuensis]|uniref:Gram-positive cocci surface proteins LPxTG domain-containing protein n=1 Tax=Kitasatospora gansuensis TaxID=258050 RepID=A0A7W7WM31_9ACTN|nr:hypothetical protein [Kitasatospora gansuensis]MBB4951690.1 hypothetical protein [Kitasatospora gansuensis]